MNQAIYDGWIKTTTQTMMYIGEAMMMASLLERGLGALLYMPIALPVLQGKLIENGKIDSARVLSSLTRMSEGDSKFARTEIDNGYQATSKHISIDLWAAIENMVEDILTVYLVHDECAVTSICNKYKLKQPSALVEEKHYRNFISQKWEYATNHNNVAARYAEQLRETGIDVSVDSNTQRVLQELSSGRDILMHNAGVVDQRFVDKCPWLGLQLGGKFSPKRDDVKRYIEHCTALTKEIHNAVLKIRNTQTGRA